LNTMKKLLIAVFCSLGAQVYGQTVYEVIDTTKVEIAKRVDFVRNYYNSLTQEEAKAFWHPKLKDVGTYNAATGIEGYSRNHVPKRIKEFVKLEIIELEILNDSLAYVKIDMRYPGEESAIATMKYYIVEDNGTLYLDNAINYERHRFIFRETTDIDFYCSPYKTIDETELMRGSGAIDSLYGMLITRGERKRIQVYWCSSIEEMNIVANMAKYYGYQGGFANSDLGFAAYMYESPVHTHEFVHLLLNGTKEHNFIMEEGMASLFGGLNPNQGYGDGKMLVRECLLNGTCSVEDLTRNRRALNLNYSVWATICEYVIKKLGKDKLFEMYYGKAVNDTNLIEEVCGMLDISEKQMFADLEAMILGHDQ